METTRYQFVKLGMHLEYLRGIGSISVMQSGSLAEFPHLLENMPGSRYSVLNVVQTIRAVLAQFEVLELKQSQEAAAPWLPMLGEMEQALGQSRVQAEVTLRDHFAEKLVVIARTVSLAVKEETSR